MRSDSASRLHYCYSMVPTAARSVIIWTQNTTCMVETPRLETGMAFWFVHRIFKNPIPHVFLFFLCKWGTVISVLCHIREQARYHFFTNYKFTNRMLRAPVLDDPNFGLHFANGHIKLHRVFKSQAFHFDSRSSPSEQSPSFMVHISDTWRSNVVKNLIPDSFIVFLVRQSATLSWLMFLCVLSFFLYEIMSLQNDMAQDLRPFWEGRAFLK